MRASINLGRIAGIAIGLHYSWLLIATLITLSLASHFRATNPDWAVTVIWVSAVVTALLFFVTLLAHELSHAVVAKSRGLPVRSITLFALGGIAQIEKDAGSAKTEFWMGIAGPITSLVIGFACLGAALAMGWSVEGSAPGPLAAILGWLGSINVILAAFNLIPGYPLDGGRVLRAILWGVSGDVDRATRKAASVGQVVAGIFIVFGLLRFFGGAGFGGLWLGFIGWFLLDAARASYAEVALMASLRGVRAGDVMARDCDTVDAKHGSGCVRRSAAANGPSLFHRHQRRRRNRGAHHASRSAGRRSQPMAGRSRGGRHACIERPQDREPGDSSGRSTQDHEWRGRQSTPSGCGLRPSSID